MPKPNVLVDGISSLTHPAQAVTDMAGRPTPQYLTVQFQRGDFGLLETDVPRSVAWADVLESLRRSNEPAYVEVDPATHIITELLAPLAVSVEALTPTAADGAVEVELAISQARHYLRRANPDFETLLHTLRTAQEQGTGVLVTESLLDHDIIDVRPLGTSLARAVLTAPPPVHELGAPVTPQRAQQLFDLVNGKNCCPCTAADPCIPFLYPDDGCWGRAHEMCRLMVADGAQPDKVWIYGNLRTPTWNHPSCQVLWGWHVAPTLLVNTGAGAQLQVVDPSLFNSPVTEATWKSVQGDPNAKLVDSSADVFHRSYSGSVQYDPTYTATKKVLEDYRRQLVLRSASAVGPPPYTQCMPKPSGVQWFGTIGANATGRWFTYGWPAAWHVVWTIMPLTPCSGAPQLTWTVQVERANATQCTYWITVRNLTASPVKFEGRYDILKK